MNDEVFADCHGAPGNKRVDVCGTLLGQQIRNALYRMRGFVERGLAKGMTCRSPMAHAVRELSVADSRGMSVVQAAVVGHFESHTITKFDPGNPPPPPQVRCVGCPLPSHTP